MNFRGYDVEHDEVLATLANSDLLEQVELGNGSNNNGDKSNQNQAIIKQTEIPTPLKAKKSLKRKSIDTMEVDEDAYTKRPKLSESSKEIVDIEDDDDRSINKGKTTIVEEESQEQSQLGSNTERTVSNPTIVGSSQASAMILQRFTLNEVETSQASSQEDLVKNFTIERNKSTNNNYRLMQQIRKCVPDKSSLLAIREAHENIFRIATSKMVGIS